MDEIETRLAALEGIVMERLALDADGALLQLAEQIRGWPDTVQRAQALQILEDARARFDVLNEGRRF